jgi:hypothetical protein
MFFLTGICEMILVDEREGLTRRDHALHDLRR